MALSTGKPTADAQNSERRHADPATLWVAVSLGSIVIHLFGFWMLRLLLMGPLLDLQSSKELIPVEVIAVAPKVTSPTQPIQTPKTTAINKPTPINTPTRRTSDSLPNRQSSSTSAASSTRTNSSLTNLPRTPSEKPKGRELPATNPSPNQIRTTPSTQSSPKPYQNQPSNSPSQERSPAGNSPSNQPSQTDRPAVTPPPASPNPPSSPTPPPAQSPTEQGSPTSQQGGGLLVSASDLRLAGSLSGTRNQLAIPKIRKKQFASSDYVAQLASNLDQVLVLEILLRIDSTGTATIQSVTPVSQGNNPVDSDQIARAIIQNWQFEPTYSVGGGAAYDRVGPVAQTYWLTLTIRPLPN